MAKSNLNTVISFRNVGLPEFQAGPRYALNLADALGSSDRARSLPELEYAPAFPRKWSSTYEALEDGIIDAKARHLVFIAHVPQRFPVPLIAVDSTSIARPKARTSKDRSAQ